MPGEAAQFREEPRFYPARYLNMPPEAWRALSPSERWRASNRLNADIRAYELERIRRAHPAWNETQVKFHFKLKFLGDCFHMAVEGARWQGMSQGDIQAVTNAPLPATPVEEAKYL